MQEQQHNRHLSFQMYANNISTKPLLKEQDQSSSSFYNLPKLKYLYLSNNTFTGTIGTHTVTQLSALTQLWINDNQFSGTFPNISTNSWPYLGKF